MNEELIAKAKAAKSAEELLSLAKENDYPLTEEEAQNYFNQFHATGELSDDELDQVGGGCGGGEETAPRGYNLTDTFGCCSSFEYVSEHYKAGGFAPKCDCCRYLKKTYYNGKNWYGCEILKTPTRN